MSTEWVLVPLSFVAFATVAAVMFFRTQRAKVEAEGGAHYRQLAEETLRNQRMLLEEVQRMNRSLQEIERLLREV